MEDFAKYYGTWLASTKKKNIQLVVNYKLSLANTMFTQLWQSVTKTSKEPNRYEKYKSSTPTSFDIGKI
jgi:glucose-6-phosphate isomerase